MTEPWSGLLGGMDRAATGAGSTPVAIPVLRPAAAGVTETAVDLGAIRPSATRAWSGEHPGRLWRRDLLALACAVLIHAGLLAATRFAPLDGLQGAATIEIPVEIVTDVPPVLNADGPGPETREAAAPLTPAPSAEQPQPGPMTARLLPDVADLPPAPPSAATEPPPPTGPPPAHAQPAVAAPTSDPRETFSGHPPDLPTARPAPAPRPPATVDEAARDRAEAVLATRRAQAAVAAQAAERAAHRREARQALDAARAAVAEAAPRAIARDVASAEDVAAYGRQVLGRITALTRYPEDARARGAQGTVVVAFSLGTAGQVTSAAVSQSSGDRGLDSEAVTTVRRAGPFGALPAGAPTRFSVPLHFRL